MSTEVQERSRSHTTHADSTGKVMLSEDKWVARYKHHLIGEGSRPYTGGSGGKPATGTRPSGNGDKTGTRSGGYCGEPSREATKKDKCKYCGKKGHWARECHKKKRDEEAHLVQIGDDEEPSLLMAGVDVAPSREPRCTYCGKKGHWASECHRRIRDETARHDYTVINDVQPSLFMAIAGHNDERAVPASTPAQAGKRIHLNEERAVVQLGDAGHHHDSPASDVWYLDTGVSNHMTGNKGAFSDLDPTVMGTVKFGDG